MRRSTCGACRLLPSRRQEPSVLWERISRWVRDARPETMQKTSISIRQCVPLPCDARMFRSATNYSTPHTAGFTRPYEVQNALSTETFYATGGLAYGHITNDGSATATGFLSPFVPPSPPCVAPGSVGPCPLATWSGGNTKTGWTIGAGIEWLVAGNWSLKAEYLYVDLGTVKVDRIPHLPGAD
jgi:hypothetical protein